MDTIERVPKHGTLTAHSNGCRCDACRQARSAYNRQHYIKNRAKRARQIKTWAENNKDLRAKISREWAKKNPERRKKADKEWRNRNPEALREKGKKWCRHHREYYMKNAKTWRQKNAERVKTLAREKRREIAELRNKLKSKPCADCGVQFPPCAMQFDHLRDKRFCVCRAPSVADLLFEAAKCEVVCACCHAIRTEKRRLEKLSENTCPPNTTTTATPADA